MAHKGLGIVGIDIRLLHHAVESLKLLFVLVVEHHKISTIAMFFEMTANNRASHSGPFVARGLAPNDDDPTHKETYIDVDNETGHECRKDSKRG